MKKELVLITALMATFLYSGAQSTSSNHELIETRKQGVYAHHADSYVTSILTGRRFVAYSNQFKQFFQGKYTTLGSLVYDGVLFEDVDLQYNVYTQEVVVLLETALTERYIMVTPDKVSGFSVYGHEFVRLSGDSVMAKGIYELAYDGVNSNVYIKHTSIEKDRIEGGEITYEYALNRKYYITNEFGTFRITGKKKLLEAFQNSPKLEAILKNHKIRFSKKRMEQDLVRAISQYETGSEPSHL